jgi:hypothetical protein
MITDPNLAKLIAALNTHAWVLQSRHSRQPRHLFLRLAKLLLKDELRGRDLRRATQCAAKLAFRLSREA